MLVSFSMLVGCDKKTDKTLTPKGRQPAKKEEIITDKKKVRVFAIKPTINGKKRRIGYLEGGPWANYQQITIAIVKELMELGWIEKINIPVQEKSDDTLKLWQWLAANVKSSYIEFAPDAYWSSNWDKETRKANKEKVLTRLGKKKDIDLMIAGGTWAGQDLANNEHSVSTIVIDANDPIAAGIVKSLDDPGYDHMHSRVDPTRYERQIRLFYELFKFKKLGMVYKNNVDGKAVAAVADVEKVAKEKGFEIITVDFVQYLDYKKKRQQYYDDGVKYMKELAPKVDAIYLTEHAYMAPENIHRVLAPLIKHRVPSFSQSGSKDVKYGVLMSVSNAGFKYIAKFHAETIAKIFNGAKAKDIPLLFESPQRIAINLKTAEMIKYTPPSDILALADEIFKNIEKK